jgi:RNA recognition motif-containing protein
MQVQSVRLIRNKITGCLEGYGFIEFISHEAAEKALQSYNGAQMPGTEHRFRLNWASFSCGERRPHEGSDHSNGPYRSIGPTRTSASIPKTSSGSRLQDGAVKGNEYL